MSWYSTGAVEAEKLAQSTFTKKARNFFTKPGESAKIRFLRPAKESFNYKSCFVPWAKGQKMLTSPETVPDPFVQAGLKLQARFAWPIIDRRVFEFEDDNGEEKKVGPRILYFSDGTRTRKQLEAFEREMLDNLNEERAEEGKEPLTLEEFNLTHYDIKASKAKKAPWNFVATRPKGLSDSDKKLIEKAELDLNSYEWLATELEPLPVKEIEVLLGQTKESNAVDGEDETETYSYSSDEDDTVSFS